MLGWTAIVAATWKSFTDKAIKMPKMCLQANEMTSTSIVCHRGMKVRMENPQKIKRLIKYSATVSAFVSCCFFFITWTQCRLVRLHIRLFIAQTNRSLSDWTFHNCRTQTVHFFIFFHSLFSPAINSNCVRGHLAATSSFVVSNWLLNERMNGLCQFVTILINCLQCGLS